VADRSRKIRILDLKLLEGATAPHSDARARLPGAPHARAVSVMAGNSSSDTGAAPLSSPLEPPAAGGHGGGAADHDDGDDDDNDKKIFSPLVDLVERFPDLFAQKVLAHLVPIDRTFLAQAGSACRAAVAASDLPRAGTREEVQGKSAWVVTHKLVEFCTSVERLAWAKASGSPWVARTCALAAEHGHLEVLQWARVHGCPWDSATSDVLYRSSWRALGGVAVGAGARVSVGNVDVCLGRYYVRAPGGGCGGRGSTSARGIRGRVTTPL